MNRPALAGLAALLLVCGARARAAADAQVRVERVSGEPVTAQRLTSIAEGSLVLGAESGEVKVPLAEVIEIGFPTPPDPPQAWSPSEVAVDLATGETIHGEIKGGDQHGFTLATPLLGDIVVPLDRLAALRFLQRLSLIPEPPDLHAAETTDVLHLAGGDRMACTIDSFAAKSVTVESATGERIPVSYEKINAMRVTGDAGRRPQGTLLVTVLRDGTQTIGSGPAVKDGRLTMKSIAGFAVNAALTDIVAAHVVSDRFAYLSDLPAAKVEVTPFWKSVAGDPAVLYAPKMDRSFTGRALRCGGRAWVKGIGVYSGTSMTWNLDGRFSEFRASAGLDDGAGPLGGVVFEVLVDGEVKWTSGYLRGAAVAQGHGKQSPAAAPRLDVKGAKTLTLRVVAGDAEDPWPVSDEADWLGAILVR